MSSTDFENDPILSRYMNRPSNETGHEEIIEALRGKEGEEVLVVKEGIDYYPEASCFGGYSGTSVRSIIKLGVLTSDARYEEGNGKEDFVYSFSPMGNVELEGPRIILPTKGYVRKGEGLEWRKDSEWELFERDIEIPIIDTIYIVDINDERTWSTGLPLGSHNPTHSERLLINIGHGEVLGGFFANKGPYQRNDLLSYVEAMRLLGEEERVPEALAEKYDKEIYDGKVRILDNLDNLLLKKKSLVERIASGYTSNGRMTEQDYFFFGEGSVMKKELEETETSIRGNLESAREKGMHEKEWTREDGRPGKTMDVPVYISALWDEYEIKVD